MFNNGGEFSNVTPGSAVVLDNGSFCASGSPGENFERVPLRHAGTSRTGTPFCVSMLSV